MPIPLEELRRQGRIPCAVFGVSVSNAAPPKRPEDDMQGTLLRDHLWLLVARWLMTEDPVFAAPDRQLNQDLAGELASVAYALDSDGRLVVESKDGMKKRLGHSPDLADALCATFGPGVQLFKKAGVWGITW